MTGVIVTGVAGLIGSHVARRLVAEGYHVIGVDDLSQGKRANVPDEIEFIHGDLSDKSVVNRFPKRVDRMLHLAGQSSGEISFDDPVLDLKKNVVSTLNLVDWAVRQDCERFIYASSMAVYGKSEDRAITESDACVPLSCYGTGKLASENYLRVYSEKLPYVSLRMFNVYGPGQDLKNLRQGMVSIYLKMALTGQQIQVKGSLDRYRDFIYIDDVVEVWYRAMKLEGHESYTLNVGTGVRTTVESLLRQIRECESSATWFSEGSTPGDQHGIYAETSRLRETLGLTRFTPLKKGLRQFVAWARENQD